MTTSEQPFIILSDINIPKVDGLEFKERIQQDDYLRIKGIPFVFISTNATSSAVRRASLLNVQGFFAKPYSVKGTIEMMRRIFEYWDLCRHINNT